MANEILSTLASEVVKNAHVSPAADIARTKLAQRQLDAFAIAWTAWRVWDALHTNLPGTSAADDLALVGGTFATGVPSLESYDVKAAGPVTLYARALIDIPAVYDDAETIVLRIHAGMVTSVADVSATVDVAAYKSDSEGAVSGADLVTTAAQDINSLAFADKDFTIDPSTIDPGDELDVRIAVAVNDGATGTEVKARLGKIALLVDTRP